MPAAPEFPTMMEAGFAGFDVTAWFGLFVPAKTPPELVAKIHHDSATALADPGVRERLEQLGMLLYGSPPGEFTAYLKAEIPKWAEVVKASGAKLD